MALAPKIEIVELPDGSAHITITFGSTSTEVIVPPGDAVDALRAAGKL